MAAAADRLSFNVRTKKSVQGTGELLDALVNNELKPEEIDQKKLPPEMQKLNHEEITERIAKARADRSGLQKEIEDLSRDRAAYIAKETKRLAVAGKGGKLR
jgi:hypothetical protein